MNINANLKKNIDFLKKNLPAEDIKYRNLLSGSNSSATIVYIDGMTNKAEINEFIIKVLESSNVQNSCEFLLEHAIETCECEVVTSLDVCIEKILDGEAIVLFDKKTDAIACSVKNWSTRAIAEPPTTTVVKGPREGFVEDLKSNTTMLRRRLKTKDLVIQYLKLGKYTNTNIAICSINGIVDKSLLDEVITKIKAIKLDGIIDSSYISKKLEKRKKSIFKQIGTSEKPDVIASRLLEGRIAIIVDGSPIALSLPYLLIEDFQNPEDYFERNYKATFSRLIRVLGVLIAILIPALFVSSQLFNISLIPFKFTITVLHSVKGLPLSPALEMLFTVLIFEILNEASIRMPKYVGMALSIVGALVLGETAVKAGIVSTPTIMIMALSGISLYTVPELNGTLSILRISFIIIAGIMGVYGILLGIIFLMTYLADLEQNNAPMLFPYAPSNAKRKNDGIIMGVE